MHWTKSIGCLGLALSATFNSAPALARVGVNAIQMTPVGLDSSANCTRSFFRSTLHFDNTIFMVPRVVPGAGPDGKRTFDMTWRPEEKKWILNLRVYFPRTSSEIKPYGASVQKRDLDACNQDQVKHSINSRLSPEVRKEQEVRTIAPIPLASLEVKIKGIADVGRLGIEVKDDGTEEQKVDEIIYYGKSLTVQLKLTEVEKEYFDSAVVRPDGLAAQVLMNYMATHSEGAIVAKVDVSGMKAAFSLAAGGTYVAKANLAADLEKAVSAAKITINTQGKSDSLEKVQSRIMDEVLKEVAKLQDVEKTKDDKDGKTKTADGQIEVDMVLRAISSKVSTTFVYNSDSVPEVATSQAQIDIKQSGVDDPNIVQLLIRSHYQDPTPGFYVHENQSFTISPARWWIEKLDYKDYIKVLSVSDIDDLKLKEKFEDLTLPGMTVFNLEEAGKPTEAIGEYTYLNRYVKGIGQLGIKGPAQYQWRIVEKLPDHIPGNSTRIDLTADENGSTIQKLHDLHVGISFTRIGSRKIYSLEQLLMPNNPFFIGSFDEASGQIKVIARPGHDLGNIEVRELNGFAVEEKKDENGKPIPTKGVEYKTEKKEMVVAEELKLGTIFTRRLKKVVLEQDDDAITLQKIMLINLTRPQLETTGIPVETVGTIRATQLEGEH